MGGKNKKSSENREGAIIKSSSPYSIKKNNPVGGISEQNPRQKAKKIHPHV
jgi:hypothetical protein